VAVVISACRPLGPDGRVGRAPLAGAQAGEQAAVPLLSLTSKRRAVGSPRVAFLAARSYFLLPSAWPLGRGEEGGVAGGKDGPRRWGGW